MKDFVAIKYNVDDEKLNFLNETITSIHPSSNEKEEANKKLNIIISDEDYKYVYNKTDKETFQAMEGFIHNLNTMHSRAGNQVVFSSINYGTDFSPEGRMVINNILKATVKGLGKGETPVFPIQVFKVKEGLNYSKEDLEKAYTNINKALSGKMEFSTPNFDLFIKAIDTTSKRLFPNFVFLDTPFNKNDKWDMKDEKKWKQEVATMGCILGKSKIKFLRNEIEEEEIAFDSIENLWSKFEKKLKNEIKHYSSTSQYINLENQDFQVFDSLNDQLVRVKKIIKNSDIQDWLLFKLANGKKIQVTLDHPFPVVGLGRIEANNINIGEKLYIDTNFFGEIRGVSYSFPTALEECFPCIEEVEIIGIEKKRTEKINSYDFETENDYFTFEGVASHNCRTRVFEDLHGEKTSISRGNLSFTSINLPRLAIESKKEIMDDIHDKNIEKLIGYEKLQKNWNGNDSEPFDKDVIKNSRELLERTKEIGFDIFPTGKGSIQFEIENKNEDYFEIEIEKNNKVSIFKVINEEDNEKVIDYDIDVLLAEINDFDYDYDQVKQEMLNKVKNLSLVVGEQLKERLDYQKTALGKQYPFMMRNGVWKNGETIEANAKVEEILNTGTLGIGFIGIHNAMVAIFGKSHNSRDDIYNFSLEIIDEMNKATTELKEKYNLNYAVLATPAEGLSGRFTRIDKSKFGIIDGVNDKDYYVNSFHVDVAENISILEKIAKEAPFHAKTLGGHISYVEVDGTAKNNLKALVKIVEAMYENNIGYGSINHPIDRCRDCGFSGIVYNDNCPVCESENIDKMRRITGK